MPALHGVDVSHFQGSAFPWAAMVQQHGITLGCTKVSQGAGFVDPTWQINRDGMRAAGLRHRGLYHWLSAGVNLASQLANFRRIGTLDVGEFVMLDIEENGLTVAEILAALELWEQTYPGRLIRYQGKFFANGDLGIYGRWPWWLPAYRSTILPTVLPVTVWQWAGGAGGVNVPNVGNVDSNEIIDRARLERVAGYTLPPSPLPEGITSMFCKDADTGKFWYVGIDWLGVWASPIDEVGIDWALIGSVNDAVNGPLKDVAHADLQRIYDHRGRPATPTDTVAEHKHVVPAMIASSVTTSGVTS